MFSFIMHLFGQNPLKKGDKMPDFSLLNQNGEMISMADYPQKGDYFVVYFYPKDQTSVCTKEACAFSQEKFFNTANIDVFGISIDDVKSHKKFAEKEKLNFNLLADTEKKIHQAFGLKPGWARYTYIIDKDKNIVFDYNAMMEGENHVKKVLEFFKSLESKKS